MDEEADDRASKEVHLPNYNNSVDPKCDKDIHLSQNCHDIEIDVNIFNSSKLKESSLNLSSDGQESRSSGLDPKIGEEDMNHFNSDPSSSLIKDIRLAANAAAEEEVNKVYMCHLCDFKTAYANSLMNHQAVHSDFRPWACTACEYAAKRKQDLKKHLHTVHGMMVESPMLKPVVAGVPGGKYIEGTKDHFIESLNLKRPSPSDQDFSMSQPTSSSQGFPSSKRVKEDAAINLFVSPHPADSSGKASSIPGGELDSPDDNLPICFPSLSSSSVKRPEMAHNLESPPLPKFLPGREEGELVFNGAHPNFSSWHGNRYSDSSVSNIPRDWANHVVKKEVPQHIAFSSKDTYHQSTAKKLHTSIKRDNSFHHSFSMSDDETHISGEDRGISGHFETDKSITSSSLAGGHGRSTQTPSGFLCEHCDILFFQRAMYVMHIGLHAPDNPWCCSVCGHTFSEKYSFTSHFINQH